MAKLKNVSVYGDADVPALRRVVPAGEVVDVDDGELAQSLIDGGHFEAVSPAAQSAVTKAANAAKKKAAAAEKKASAEPADAEKSEGAGE
jgi:hypothetical protein